MNYLLPFQFRLNIWQFVHFSRDVSSTLEMAIAAVYFCLVDIKCKHSLQGD